MKCEHRSGNMSKNAEAGSRINMFCCQFKHLKPLLVRARCINGQVCLIMATEKVSLFTWLFAYRGSCSIPCPGRPGWPNTHASHSDSNSGRVSRPLGPSSRDSTSSSWPLAHSWETHWPGRGRGQWAITVPQQQHWSNTNTYFRLWKSMSIDNTIPLHISL